MVVQGQRKHGFNSDTQSPRESSGPTNDLSYTWVQSLPHGIPCVYEMTLRKTELPLAFYYEVKGPDAILSNVCLFVYVPEYTTCTIDCSSAATTIFKIRSNYLINIKSSWTFNMENSFSPRHREEKDVRTASKLCG